MQPLRKLLLLLGGLTLSPLKSGVVDAIVEIMRSLLGLGALFLREMLVCVGGKAQ